MLVFCTDVYFQLKSASLVYDQTNIYNHMTIDIDPIYSIFQEFLKAWSFFKNLSISKTKITNFFAFTVFILLIF